MTTAIENIDPTQVTGYAADDRYLATRYIQGGRTVYDFELSLDVIPAILPVPDPNRPTSGNRRVNYTHAHKFGIYVREHEDWVAPGLLLRAPDIFKFDVLQEIGGVQFGILSIPRNMRGELKILDGQHRVLGLNTALLDIASEIDEQRSLQSKAKQQDNPDLEATYQAAIAQLEGQRRRLGDERLGIQVLVETDPLRYEQMFYDVAENALGITSAVKVRFDSRKMVNRTLDPLLKHPLLQDRVDLEQDRMTASNPNLLGAKHVVDLVRTVTVGIAGRMTKRREDELDEGALVENTNALLDVFVEAFPDLKKVAEGALTPPELRRTSLLGSTTMLRVLAGVYYELVEQGLDEEQIQDFLERLAPHLVAPVVKGSPWLTINTKVFLEDTSAPTARSQDLRHLTDEITSWVRNPPGWLS